MFPFRVQSLMRASFYVTAHDYSCCRCDGSDYCPPVIYADAANQGCPLTTDSSSGYFTVTFTPASCCTRTLEISEEQPALVGRRLLGN